MSAAPEPFHMADPRAASAAEFGTDKWTGSPYPRCSPWLRLGARLADLALAYGIFHAGGRVGAVLAILYILLADGIFEGQSIGKKIFGVRVVHLPTRSSGRKRDSTLRNAPLALPVLLGMMPGGLTSADRGLGFHAFVAGAIAIGAVEAWRAIRDPLGMRFGDIWAQTQVVDGKVVAGAVADIAPRGRGPVTERAAGRATLAARVRRGGHRRIRRTRCGSL
jgi:uncharacterized RDD family membrane protein YckC